MSCNECKAISRRDLLATSGLAFGALALDPILSTVARTYAQSSGGTGNILVLCQLDGGLDSLSFLAPYTNPQYQADRPKLALKADDVTPCHDNPDYGINNLFPYFASLYTAGQLAIVQQCGYPRENGSHFESRDIFEYGVREVGSREAPRVPWYERLRETYFNQPYGAMTIDRIGNPANYGYPDNSYRRSGQDAFGRLAELKRARGDATPMQREVVNQYFAIDSAAADLRERTAAFTSTGAARGQFYNAAAIASANLGTQILKVRYGGFDTHGSQDTANQTLFPRLNNEFQQFVADMQQLGLWDRTTVLFYSEFGRRNYENGSPGTDHGYGGHMFLAGPKVRGGLYGQRVTTSDLVEDVLPSYVDFRAVFSAAIRDWLGFNPRPIFQYAGESYDENTGGALFR
jgi:uncharacterized protein (DUF1501 family)